MLIHTISYAVEGQTESGEWVRVPITNGRQRDVLDHFPVSFEFTGIYDRHQRKPNSTLAAELQSLFGGDKVGWLRNWHYDLRVYQAVRIIELPGSDTERHVLGLQGRYRDPMEIESMMEHGE